MSEKRLIRVCQVLFLCAGGVWSASAQTKAPARYRLYDVGNLGGHISLFYNFDQVNFTPMPLNREGELAGTSVSGAGYAAGFVWRNGVLRELANLTNANEYGGGANANGINDAGSVVGAANNGELNPLNDAPYDHAVLWTGDGIKRLPELGGNESWANFITDDWVIAGYANNTTPDPYTYAGTQTRAVLWRYGMLKNLGTLGGTDSAAFIVKHLGSERDDDERHIAVIGTSSLAKPAGPPFGVPPSDAFVWSEGVMRDLGGLGGGFSTPSDINSDGEITVISFDSTNQHFQSFLWHNGTQTLLEKLGGNFVEAVALNRSGLVIGAVSDTTDSNAIAAVWDRDGKGHTLGTIETDKGSIALGVNYRGVVVGGSGTVGFTAAPSYSHAFIWREGEGIRDLNTMVAAGAELTLNVAYAINERGEIAGLGTNAAGDTHAFVLKPDYDCRDESEFVPATAIPAAPGSFVQMESPLERLLRRSGLQGRPAVSQRSE